MASLFRSEEMCLAQLYLQTESAYACVSELGELGLVQFRDLNPDVNAFQLKFVNEVRRCDEMERKLRFLERELSKDNVPIGDVGENPEAPPPREMIELESTFEKLENEMQKVNVNQETLKRNYLELKEFKHLLHQTQHFFKEAELYQQQQTQQTDDAYFSDEELVPASAGHDHARTPFTKLGFVAGVIARERVHSFERVLWRACRGNVFLRHSEIEAPLEDPRTGEDVYKSVFIIFFQGDKLKSRVQKICEGFRAVVYPCPEKSAERISAYADINEKIEELSMVLDQTDQHRKRVLSEVATSIRTWLIKVHKIKAIYHTLNLFNVNIAEKCLIAECWCPVNELNKIQFALHKGTEASQSSVPSILHKLRTDAAPPTYNRTSTVTSAFQSMVDAYGIANYREVNPAIFTVITFPFLFGVMFGDLGHGIMLFLFGLWIVLLEKRLANLSDSEFWEMIFGGRYILLLMGAFSIHAGFIYNDFLSLSLDVFGSAWNASAMNYSESTLNDDSIKFLTLDPAKSGVYRGSGGDYPNVTSFPYPYGMDPIWQLAENKVTFMNSYKMKGAVIIGIVHMLFGLFISLANYIHFRQVLNIVTVFIPQFLFLMSTFGYMVGIIVYKWAAWSADESMYAPSLLIGLINMFMFTAPSKEDHTLLYTGQNEVQIALVLTAALCVPWLLLLKPAILYYRYRRRKQYRAAFAYGNTEASVNVVSDDSPILSHDQLENERVDGEENNEDEEEFDMAELMIHQMIETIEYCLSCISHTASYLRLWALSLAHAELSEVLWNMVMHIGLSQSGYLGAFLNFFIFWEFAWMTIIILLCMEGLSAFLHALRLHWVEFQDKFYGGEGYPFVPFSFKAIIEAKAEE